MKSRMTLKTFSALAVLGLVLAACDNPTGIDGGRVQLTLTSGDALALAPAATAPAATGDWEHERPALFQSANVTFASILARNVDGVLVDMDMDLPVTVDIVAMEEGGRTVTLPDGDLPPATYDQVVVVMTEVQAVLRDGTTITIDPPGGGWTSVVPVCPFEVADDATAVVGLVLPVRSALAFRDGRFRFQPRFRSRIECAVEEPPVDDGDGTDG